MAVSERKKRIRYMLGRRREKTPTQELAARLAPLEETDAVEETRQAVPAEGHAPDDTIRVNTAAVKVPNKFSEEERQGARIFYLEPVVIVILVLMFIFIGFIAWQAAIMTPPGK